MKKYNLFVIACLVLWLGSSVNVVAQTGTSDAETEVKAAQEKYRTALLQHDAAALRQIWADDYTFINGAGALVTKEGRLANLDSGATSLSSIDLSGDTKIRVNGDVAVSTSTVALKGQYSGNESSGDYRSMMVWVKRGDRWQLLANQITPIVQKH